MSKNYIKRPFPLLATFMTLMAVIILCGLGTWQVKRLAWKEGLLAQLDALYAEEPQDSNTAALRELHPVAGTLFVARVRLHGTLDPAASWLVGPRTMDGQSGYHLITPLTLAGGGTVLVNRGWVKDRPAQDNAGQVTVTGLLRPPEKPNRFVPANAPADDQWFSLDPARMAQARNLGPPLPFILYAEDSQPVDSVAHPAGSRPNLPNNHKAYAFFWFSMAGVLLVIYILRFFGRPLHNRRAYGAHEKAAP